MYFRYVLVAVLLACTYGYEITDNGISTPYECVCENGVLGTTFQFRCNIGYQYCGATGHVEYSCCVII